MADDVIERRGVPILLCDADGPPIADPQDALDVIGSAFSRAEVVAVPAVRFDARFFQLRSGLAGEIMQKFVNYQMKLAVVGDISEHVGSSSALRDLVTESNRGRHIWFVRDLDDLDTHLGAVNG
jgi:hypothetical protein